MTFKTKLTDLSKNRTVRAIIILKMFAKVVVVGTIIGSKTDTKMGHKINNLINNNKIVQKYFK